MKVRKEKINLKTDDWNFKIDDEGRRMKIYIKLNKAETTQWASLKNAAVGPGMSDGEFAKIMLFRGLNNFVEDLNKAVSSMSEEEKNKILSEATSVGSDVSLEVSVPEKPDAITEDSDKQG